MSLGDGIAWAVLATWWGLLTWAALLGLAWVLFVWARITHLCRLPGWAAAEQGALAGRLRDALYRLLVKGLLFAFALVRWDILQSTRPAVLDGRQILDALFMTALILTFSVWSGHQFWAANRRAHRP